MKKTVSMFTSLCLCAAMMVLLNGCAGKTREQVPLPEIPESYSLEDAKKDGCVVHENGDISSGEKAWDSFVEQSSDGKPSSVRIGYYYTLDDSAKYTAEDYERLKKEYPVLLLKDLEFDGEQYTLLSYEDGSEQKREYSYLKKFEGDAGADAVYDSYIQYVLTDEKDATWEQLMKSLYSSKISDFIDFQIVYTDYIYE